MHVFAAVGWCGAGCKLCNYLEDVRLYPGLQLILMFAPAELYCAT